MYDDDPYPGLNLGEGAPDDVPRFLRPLYRGARRLPDAMSAIGDTLAYPFESVPVDEGAPPAPQEDVDGVPYYLSRERPALDLELGGGPQEHGAPVPLPKERQPNPDAGDDYLADQHHGQVDVTIGGKTYHYGSGDRMPVMFRGGFGGGNLASIQKEGVHLDREPDQISPEGMAEEDRRGGTGVSTMETNDILPSELEHERRRAAMSRAKAAAEDPYGIQRYRLQQQAQEDVKAAAEREKTRRDENRGQHFGEEMESARTLYNNRMDHLEKLRHSLAQEKYEALRQRAQSDYDVARETIAGKYGVRLPKQDDLANLLSGMGAGG